MKELYGKDWIMRLYYQIPEKSPAKKRLCSLACQDPNIDICNVETIPRFGNLSKAFPLNWRFLPAVDDQVDVLLVRDLDSEISPREVAAVNDFFKSDKHFHIMRDHPHHGVQILGGTWGIRLLRPEVREKMAKAMKKMLSRALFYTSRDRYGPDQKILTQLVWPWAKKIALSHDSYFCRSFAGTRPFPTKRTEGVGNFVGAVVQLNNTITFTKEYICPEPCRPHNHTDWTFC